MIFNMLYTVLSTLILKPIFLYMKKELFISVCWKILMGNSSGCSLPKLWHFYYGRVYFIYIYIYEEKRKKSTKQFEDILSQRQIRVILFLTVIEENESVYQMSNTVINLLKTGSPVLKWLCKVCTLAKKKIIIISLIT